MPIVDVKLVEGRSEEQKREMAKKITDTLVEDGGAKAEAVTVIFHDLKDHDFSKSGKLFKDL